ncbi:MAG: hypothetical protein JHD16_01025 [Solirubrobacteraceae bacterium]|nr:hypothetical protein [Solirubrobacteraceae bacterium]
MSRTITTVAVLAAAALAVPAASAAPPVVGGAAPLIAKSAPTGLPDPNDAQFRVPAGMVEHRVWTRTVTGRNAVPANERHELWLSATRSRVVVTDAKTKALLREVTTSPTETRVYDAETGKLRVTRHSAERPPHQSATYEQALHRAYVTGGFMEITGERTVAGRRHLVLVSVPGKWRSDEPDSRTTAVVDAETFAPHQLTSSVPDLFTQQVTHRVVERLSTGKAVNAKLKMRKHRR